MSYNLITPEPKLLPVPISFSVPDGYILIGNIDFTATISYLEHDQNFSSTVTGTIPSSEDINYSYYVDFGTVIIGGVFSCDLGLSVQEIASGATSTYPIHIDADIIGSNPDKNDVKAMLTSLPLQVIAYKESSFQQFNNDGTPRWGTPHGFGIMQVDPPDNAAEIFNWQANIKEGLNRYSAKAQTAVSYPSRIRNSFPDATDFDADQLKLDIYQLYNGGHYWVWDDTNKIWTPDPNRNDYGDDANRIENLVMAGTPPPDWE